MGKIDGLQESYSSQSIAQYWGIVKIPEGEGKANLWIAIAKFPCFIAYQMFAVVQLNTPGI